MKLPLIWFIVSSFVFRTQAQCSSSQFACSNGNCVPSTYQCDRDNDCADNSDEVDCVCYVGDIRLTGTESSVSQGNVELCIFNTFNAICGNVWSSNDAKVVCRQLGFNSSTATTSSLFGPATTANSWTRRAGGCTGTESTLYSCPVYPVAVSCTGANPAAVICSTPYCPSNKFQCTNGLCIATAYVCDGYNDCRDNSDEINCLCTKGMVRLEGGTTSAGTVGVCMNNKWEQVCDTYWTAADAKVVCSQLGYEDGQALSGSYYGSGYDSSYWTSVGGCRGNESKITECAYTTPVQSCSSYAGVSCYNSASVSDFKAAAIGGGVGGGILLLLVILCVCVCTYCLCKKSKKNGKTKMAYRPLQPVPERTQTPSGSPNIIVVQNNTQNVITPPAQDPYYYHPQREPYSTTPPYAITPGDAAFPQHQYQSYTDPNSYLPGLPNAAPYNAVGIPGQFGGNSFPT